MHLLLIDDDIDFLILIKSYLNKLDNEIIIDITTSVVEFFELLKGKEIDIIISDYEMPEINGLDILKQLRDEGNQIPFILFTGKGREEVAMKAINLGANRYVTKGGNIDTQFNILLNAIKAEVTIKKIENETIRLNSLLKSLYDISSVFRNETNEESILQNVCNKLNEVFYVKNVWIGLTDTEMMDVIPIACSGFEHNFLSTLKVKFDDSKLGNGPTETAIKTEKPFVMRDIINDPNFYPWRDQALLNGYSSSIALPLITEEVFGVINVYSVDKNAFGDKEVEFLNKISSDISLGINSLRMEKKFKNLFKELETNKEILSLAIKMSEAGVYSYSNPIDQTAYINDRWSEILGFTPKELQTYKNLLKWSFKRVHLDDIPLLNDLYYKFINNSKSKFDIELRMRHKTEKWIDIRAISIATERYDNGTAKQISGIMFDITDQKRKEEFLSNMVEERTRDLLEEQNKIKSIIELIPSGIFILLSSGNVVLFNKSFEKLYSDTLKTPISQFVNINEFQDHILTQEIKFHLKFQGFVKSRIELNKKHFLISSIDYIPVDKPLGKILEFSDISHLIDIDVIRKQFVSTVSHELRTPITGIKLLITNLMDYGKNISELEKYKMMELLAYNANNLSTLIEDLLIISRIDEGKIEVKITEINLFKIIKGVINQLLSQIEEKSLEVQIEVDENIYINGDIIKISQIIRNLVDNAIKYNIESGNINIKAFPNYRGKYNPDNINGNLIKITDTGIGIAEHDVERIFQRFYRSQRVENIKGSGLGLAIAQELALIQDFKIYIESELGKGTSIFLFFKTGVND